MRRRLLLAALLLLPSAALAANPVVRLAFDPTLGHFDLELCREPSTACQGVAPNTVANFLNYVNRGAYVFGSFIHRDVTIYPGDGSKIPFIFQGGTYYIDPNQNPLFPPPEIPTDPPIANEFNQPNTRGTISVPLLSTSDNNPCATDPNSGTSGFFVNLSDNSQTLDCGHYTVFGVVEPEDLPAIDRIGALTAYCFSTTAFCDPNSAFDEVPLLASFSGPDPIPYLVYYSVHPLAFDDGGPATEGGSLQSDLDVPAQRADDFLLAGPGWTAIDAVQWWGQYLASNTPVTLDAFKLRVFADDGGGASHLPTGPPLVERTLHNILRGDTGTTSGASHVFEYLATFPSFGLPPGRYWLSIVNDTTADATSHWYWSRSDAAAGDERVRAHDTDAWAADTPGTMAFALLPEPDVAVQGALALGALLWIARRRAVCRPGVQHASAAPLVTSRSRLRASEPRFRC
jgi:cyclophilin family peptidyl-prolyl cis-trans isomerase